LLEPKQTKLKAGEQMRKLLIALAGIAYLALPMAGTAQTVLKGIEGSVHDFSTNSWNTRKGVCSTCHQAHHTDENQIVPLWNHETTTETFTPYESPTLNATVGAPTGISLACLSCHDGSLAINQGISGLIGGVSGGVIDPSAQIGPDLHTTHPIGFTYDTALAVADGGGLEDPATYKIGDAKTELTYSTAPVPASWSGSSLTGKTINEALLFDGQMHCSSCHDVHKQEGSSPSSGILVRISGTDAGGKGSVLCRTCHIK
jgi:hypothetical protein